MFRIRYELDHVELVRFVEPSCHSFASRTFFANKRNQHFIVLTMDNKYATVYQIHSVFIVFAPPWACVYWEVARLAVRRMYQMATVSTKTTPASTNTSTPTCQVPVNPPKPWRVIDVTDSLKVLMA